MKNLKEKLKLKQNKELKQKRELDAMDWVASFDESYRKKFESLYPDQILRLKALSGEIEKNYASDSKLAHDYQQKLLDKFFAANDVNSQDVDPFLEAGEKILKQIEFDTWRYSNVVRRSQEIKAQVRSSGDVRLGEYLKRRQQEIPYRITDKLRNPAGKSAKGKKASPLNALMENPIPNVEMHRATASECIDVHDALKITKSDLVFDGKRLEHFLNTGLDYSPAQAEASKASQSEACRKIIKASKIAFQGLSEAAAKLTKGIAYKSDPSKSSYHRKYTSTKEALIKAALSKLDPGHRNYAAAVARCYEAAAANGNWMDNAPMDQVMKFLTDEIKKVDDVDTKELDELNKKLNDLNAAMKTAMTNSDPDDSSKNGILKEQDDMFKYRVMHAIMIFTPFGLFSLFNYLDPIFEILQGVFDGATSAAKSIASLSNSGFLGPIGDLAGLMKIDVALQAVFENTPILAQVLETIDALTDNQIFQGLANTVGPGVMGSPLTGIAAIYFSSIFRLSAEIEHYKKVNTFVEAEDKKVKDTIDGVVNAKDTRHKGGLKAAANTIFDMNKAASVDIELTTFLSVLRWNSRSNPTSTKDLFGKLFKDVKFNDGGAAKDLWTLMDEKKLNSCEDIIEFLKKIPGSENAAKEKLKSQFLTYSAIIKNCEKDGNLGEELQNESLKILAAGVGLDKLKAQGQEECNQKFILRMAEKYGLRYEENIMDQDDKMRANSFGDLEKMVKEVHNRSIEAVSEWAVGVRSPELKASKPPVVPTPVPSKTVASQVVPPPKTIPSSAQAVPAIQTIGGEASSKIPIPNLGV